MLEVSTAVSQRPAASHIHALSFISDLPEPATDEEVVEPEPIVEPTPVSQPRRLGFRFLPPKRVELPDRIETARLVLRPFAPTDLTVIHKIYGDADVMRSVGAMPATTLDQLMTRLDRLISHQERRGFSLWAAIDKATGEIVGDAGLIEHAGGPDIELSYRFRKETWGMGYAREALLPWVPLAFEHLPIERLLAFSHPKNSFAPRLFTGIGMMPRGMSRRMGQDVLEFVLGRGAYEHRRS